LTAANISAGTAGINISGNAATATTSGACSGNAATATNATNATNLTGAGSISASTTGGAGLSVSYAATAGSAPATTFVSSNVTFPAAGTQASAAHGLGAVPSSVSVRMICTTAEYGYSIGDEIDITSSYSQTTIRTVSVDATNIYFEFNATMSSQAVYQKGGGVPVNLTAGSWALKFRAVK
jgi:hypothetical protein